MNKLERLIALHEGFRGRPYIDTVGKTTIGYGRNLDDNPLTQEEALTMMRNDIQKSRQELSSFSWFRAQNEARQNALIDMHFNLGLPRLLAFKRMIAALSDGLYAEAAHQALDSKWAMQVGKRAERIAEILNVGEMPDDILY